MKIVVLDGYAINPGDLSWEPIASLGDLTVYESTEPSDIAIRAKDADAILINRLHIGEEELQAMPRLKYIGTFATGFNMIDLEAARRHGVTVCNIPFYSTPSVAQHTIALLLEIANHAGYYDCLAHEQLWSGMKGFNYRPHPVVELEGKTFGVIGFGHIGSAVARKAEGLGMKIAVCTSQDEANLPEGYTKMDMEELFEKCDVVSVHCPLNEQTQGMIGADLFNRMKPTAVFLNTARGAVTDETALAKALEEHKFMAAAVDVMSEEPPRSDHPLLSVPNCIITPHIGWASREARERAISYVAANIAAFQNGKPTNAL